MGKVQSALERPMARDELGRWTPHPLEFTVPGPPVPKARARVVRNGRHSYTPEATTEYEARVRMQAMLAVATYARSYGKWPRNATEYRLSCHFYRSTNRGDLANYIKAVEDALNPVRGAGREASRIVWPDDARVTSYGPMGMTVDRDNPHTTVRIEVIG